MRIFNGKWKLEIRCRPTNAEIQYPLKAIVVSEAFVASTATPTPVPPHHALLCVCTIFFCHKGARLFVFAHAVAHATRFRTHNASCKPTEGIVCTASPHNYLSNTYQSHQPSRYSRITDEQLPQTLSRRSASLSATRVLCTNAGDCAAHPAVCVGAHTGILHQLHAPGHCSTEPGQQLVPTHAPTHP